MFRPIWIEINRKALRDNFRKIKRIVGRKVKIVAIIKQFAYGHGLVPIAREFSFCGVDFFGVDSLEEAIILREEGFKEPILVLSNVSYKFASYFIKYKITPTLMDLIFAERLNREAKKLKVIAPVHIKIDTGMGRLGVWWEDAYGFVKKVLKFKNLLLEGIYTHFPSADEDVKFTSYQISIFSKLIDKLKKEGIIFKYQHCANSAGILRYPFSHFNMVRPGLILYGVNPFKGDKKVDLKPALSLKSKIIFIKKVKKGCGISYGRTYIAKKDTLIGVIAAGYADGYPWELSNSSRVIIKDGFFNIVGRVCMDHIMVDLKQRRDIKPGDEVILIGAKNNCKITVEELSFWAKTIPYEILTRLSQRVPRIYK
jgi:alanine racemase